MTKSSPFTVRAIIALIVFAGLTAGGAYWWRSRAIVAADPLGPLKARGYALIGVRANAAPFSKLDAKKEFVGYEPDIAHALGEAINLPVRFVSTDPANFREYLKRGVIDAAILPHDAVDPAKDGLRDILPGYFASGLEVLTLASTKLKSWDELRKQSVCGIQGNARAQRMIEELGATYVPFPDMGSAEQALAAERCRALVEDEVTLAETLASDETHRYAARLEPVDSTVWAIAIRAGDKGLAAALQASLARWHKGGALIQRAQAWELPENRFLAETRAYFAGK